MSNSGSSDNEVKSGSDSPDSDTKSGSDSADNEPGSDSSGEDKGFYNAKGWVYRLHECHGTILMLSSVKKSVNFENNIFEDGEYASFSASKLCVGDEVVFNAEVRYRSSCAYYHATTVKRTGLTWDQKNDSFSGIIDALVGTFGFIKFGEDSSKSAFFHITNVQMPQNRKVKTLKNVLTVGDVVDFYSMPKEKPRKGVQWVAIQVRCPRLFERLSEEQSLGDSDSDSFIPSFTMYQDREKDGHKENNEEEIVNLDASLMLKAGETFPPPVNGMHDTSKGSWECLQKLSGQKGLFFPKTDIEGEIKFASDVALASTNVVYRGREEVVNLLWEMAENQEVTFDAVQSEEGKWIATLVWTEERPSSAPCVEDCEDAFYELCASLRFPVNGAPPVYVGSRLQLSTDESKGTAAGTVPQASQLSASASSYARRIAARATDVAASCKELCKESCTHEGLHHTDHLELRM